MSLLIPSMDLFKKRSLKSLCTRTFATYNFFITAIVCQEGEFSYTGPTGFCECALGRTGENCSIGMIHSVALKMIDTVS